jgi:hypothetical protein
MSEPNQKLSLKKRKQKFFCISENLRIVVKSDCWYVRKRNYKTKLNGEETIMEFDGKIKALHLQMFRLKSEFWHRVVLQVDTEVSEEIWPWNYYQIKNADC